MLKKLINYFRNPEKVYGTGGMPEIPDFRDYKHEEVAAKSTPVTWVEKPQSEWKTYPKSDQDGSGSCVGQTVAKLLGVENVLEEDKFVHFSARDIYSRGYIENGGGMYGREGMKIGKEHGATLEQLMPSQKMNEKQMRVNDSTVLSDQIASIGRGGDYIFLYPIDFDSIAEVLDTGKAIGGGVAFNPGGFKKGEVKLSEGGKYRHWITYVDYTMWEGQRALVFDNTWGSDWGLNGQGVITEDQINGMYSAWYYRHLENDWRDVDEEDIKPMYTFKSTLKVGDRNNDVVALQDILKYEGLFPTNVESTGNYFGITARAVYDFQVEYNVAGMEELNSLAGTITGPKTIAKLNEIYSK